MAQATSFKDTDPADEAASACPCALLCSHDSPSGIQEPPEALTTSHEEHNLTAAASGSQNRLDKGCCLGPFRGSKSQLSLSATEQCLQRYGFLSNYVQPCAVDPPLRQLAKRACSWRFWSGDTGSAHQKPAQKGYYTRTSKRQPRQLKRYFGFRCPSFSEVGTGRTGRMRRDGCDGMGRDRTGRPEGTDRKSGTGRDGPARNGGTGQGSDLSMSLGALKCP